MMTSFPRSLRTSSIHVLVLRKEARFVMSYAMTKQAGEKGRRVSQVRELDRFYSECVGKETSYWDTKPHLRRSCRGCKTG